MQIVIKPEVKKVKVVQLQWAIAHSSLLSFTIVHITLSKDYGAVVLLAYWVVAWFAAAATVIWWNCLHNAETIFLANKICGINWTCRSIDKRMHARSLFLDFRLIDYFRSHSMAVVNYSTLKLTTAIWSMCSTLSNHLNLADSSDKSAYVDLYVI